MHNTHTSPLTFDLDEGFSLIVCKCPFTFCRGTCPTAASLWKTPRPTTSCSISIDDATPNHPTSKPPQCQPVNFTAIRAQISASMATMNWLFPILTPTTTMPLPSQLTSTFSTPTPSSTTPDALPKHSQLTSQLSKSRFKPVWQLWIGSFY